jgi:26S proteasome regulatory subunit T5
MATLEDKSLWENQDDNEDIDKDVLRANPEEINNRTRLLENDIKVRQ